LIDAFAELTLEMGASVLLERFYVEDLEANVVEVWDFFSRGDGARAGVDALR
jgi:hypothetical protein